MGPVSLPGPDEVPEQVYDQARLAAVRASGLLDTPPEEAFDALASLAAMVTNAPLAFITIVDDQRSYWKSSIGLETVGLVERQNPVQDSFCKYLIATGGPVILDDVTADERVRDNPTVVTLGIGAWAGYPIRGPGGEILGGLCVIDPRPRRWTDREIRTLATLSRAASGEVGLRQALVTAERQAADLKIAGDAATALARTLQESLLPPLLPTVPGVQTAAHYVAAGGTRVIGDFYDLFPAHGPWWCVVMGDVCGHGVEAAKITALARYTLRAEANQQIRPSRVLQRLHRALLAQVGDSGRYLTAVYATFRNTATGIEGRLCTAGHPPALLRRADGGVETVGAPGTLLGALPDVRLSDVEFELLPGDTLLLYTDGVTESRNGATGVFGEEGLSKAFSDAPDFDARACVEFIADAAAQHSFGHIRDDIALLAIRVPAT